MWTCTQSTATLDCRTCRGRKGCRMTAAPIQLRLIFFHFRTIRRRRRTSSESRSSAFPPSRLFFKGKDRAVMWNSRNTLQLSNFRDSRAREAILGEFERCYFLKCYLVACEYCIGLYVTHRNCKSLVIFSNFAKG